jgi:hypothetical protein
MILAKHTKRTNKTLAVKYCLRSWGALTVSVDLLTEDPQVYYSLSLSERELRELLKKIEDRKEEIDIIMKGSNE